MTAPYYPGTQPGQPQQPIYPAQPGVLYTQQPGFAPAPAYPQPGFAPPQYQQPPQQPQYGQPPQLPQQFQGADLNARLGGPGIPPELQGRTVAEGLRYYGIMREEFARMRQQPQQPLQGQPGQQPQQPQQPAPQFSAQPRVPQQGVPGQPDPMRQYITDGLREVLPEMLAPLTAPITQRQVQETYGAVRSRYPDWAQFEGDIMQSLQGANAAQLSNPDVLEAAYFYAKGRGMSRPAQPQGQPGYQPAGYPSYLPGPQAPAGYAPPMPQQYSATAPAFVEGPTPPPPQSFSQNGQANDPRDELFARRFNVPVEVFRSWKTGQGQSSHLGVLRAPQQTVPQQQGNGQPMQPQYQQQPWQGGPQAYQPQTFAPPAQYQQPVPQGYFQPSLTNGDGYGR